MFREEQRRYMSSTGLRRLLEVLRGNKFEL